MLIPKGLMRGLSLIPEEMAVALIIRHSIRDKTPEGQVGDNVPLTAEGRQLAELLGITISSRLASIMSSPIWRCTETADHIIKGSGRKFSVTTSRLLGDPGAFIKDGQAAWINFQKMGTSGVMMHLAREDDALPGMNNPREAAHTLLKYMLTKCVTPGLHIYVTHDVVLAGIAGQLIKGIETQDSLPGFLEGAFFWRVDGRVFGRYQNRSSAIEQTG